MKVVQEVSPTDKDKYECINISRMTILRWTEEVANNVRNQLKNITKNFVLFSLPLDDSTGISNTPQLAILSTGK